MANTQKLKQLLTLNLALTVSSNEDLLEMITGAAAEMTGSAGAMLLLMDPNTGEFRPAPGKEDEKAKTTIPTEGSVAGWVLRRGEPLVLDQGAPELDQFVETQSAGDLATRNMAAVPLETRGRVLGVLEVSNKQDADGYDEQDVQMLKALASLAAMASDNSHLLQQTDLIAEFMHEVKTPLMALTAASELLARDLNGKKQVELIEMIQRETMRLSNMAQDFLDLSRLEAGRAQITREPVDLAGLIHDVVRLQEPQAAARDIAITVEVEGDLPVVSGDYDRLRQVFLNLTSNAIKYNEDGGQIFISACRRNEEFQVEITDTGPGIAAENLPHLFERFYRIPDSEGFTKGTGLGLSIAARLLREHGGRIEVQSELGRGSTFRCFLPIQA
ncbi:MAG: GAF domain-containing sensor histidine kinase [Chloroflexota bacterium]|jgi:signal transduction histidine kinase